MITIYGIRMVYSTQAAQIKIWMKTASNFKILAVFPTCPILFASQILRQSESVWLFPQSFIIAKINEIKAYAIL